jgi:predicted PurR-regulated permease PerM
MSLARPITFWITMLAVAIVVVVLLREVLLPFVAGMMLAYLLDPLATRLEQLGMNRLTATLTIVGLFVVGVVGLVALTAPLIVGELAYFIDSFPIYIRTLQGLATDPTRPWLSRLVGVGLDHAQQSIGELTTLATGWLDDVLREVWSGGRALISVFSLAVVTPVVACYIVYDWNRMIEVMDNWVPPARRDTVRALAREINDTIGGFVVGQGALCLILAVFYAVALSLAGLNHAIFIGIVAGLISFVPYLGSLTALGIDVRRRRAVLAELAPHFDHSRDLFCRPVSRGLCTIPIFRWPACQPESCLDDIRAFRFRLPVRLGWPFNCGAAGRCYRRPRALRVKTILREPALCCCPGGSSDGC